MYGRSCLDARVRSPDSSQVEQCFSLSAFSYTISYKDDDGEITDITTESDLTEAIQYFQAGSDDFPSSSAASILSGRSFGRSKITLRVHINVDYDGPSLSDTSSLVSIEEYKGRNTSEYSLSFHASDLADGVSRIRTVHRVTRAQTAVGTAAGCRGYLREEAAKVGNI